MENRSVSPPRRHEVFYGIDYFSNAVISPSLSMDGGGDQCSSFQQSHHKSSTKTSTPVVSNLRKTSSQTNHNSSGSCSSFSPVAQAGGVLNGPTSNLPVSYVENSGYLSSVNSGPATALPVKNNVGGIPRVFCCQNIGISSAKGGDIVPQEHTAAPAGNNTGTFDVKSIHNGSAKDTWSICLDTSNNNTRSAHFCDFESAESGPVSPGTFTAAGQHQETMITGLLQSSGPCATSPTKTEAIISQSDDFTVDTIKTNGTCSTNDICIDNVILPLPLETGGDEGHIFGTSTTTNRFHSFVHSGAGCSNSVVVSPIQTPIHALDYTTPGFEYNELARLSGKIEGSDVASSCSASTLGWISLKVLKSFSSLVESSVLYLNDMARIPLLALSKHKISNALLTLRAAYLVIEEKKCDDEDCGFSGMFGAYGATLLSPLDAIDDSDIDSEEDRELSKEDRLIDEEEEEPFLFPVRMVAESPAELESCPRILSDSMLEQLVNEGLPFSLRIQQWERIYAIGRDGDSFLTMIDRCSRFKNTIIVVKTMTGNVLGGFVSEYWKSQEGFHRKHCYYGNGESFLFSNNPALEPALDDDDDTVEIDTDSSKELHIYKWTGLNDYCQFCDEGESTIAMGGHGGFGLIIKDDFYRGESARCSTYGNPPLTTDTDGCFAVACFEVYGIRPFSLFS